MNHKLIKAHCLGKYGDFRLYHLTRLALTYLTVTHFARLRG